VPRKQPKPTSGRLPLITRILDAAPDIKVREVVAPARLNNLPVAVRDVFGDMKIKWAANRAWGLSFTLGQEDCVTLGHRRGDHLCTHPSLFGLTPAEAERLLCIQLEGTLLHELGHAVFDLYLQDHKGFKEAATAALADGPPSTYRGQDANGMSAEDLLHEMFAEAFRYWCHADADLRAAQPAWDALATRVADNAGTHTGAASMKRRNNFNGSATGTLCALNRA
jgi:hypothetical protein